MGSNQQLAQPTSTDVSDAAKILGRLGFKEILPELAPKLRAITMQSVAAMRKQRGDVAGNNGPACCILNATVTPGDGGVGVFYWHDTIASTTTTPLDDNGKTYVQAMGDNGAFMKPGAWVRVQATGALLRISYINSTTVPTGSLASFPGAKSYVVEGVGCGGGGGGCVANSAAGGGGGGAGAPGEWTGTIIPVNWTVVYGTVGAGGTTAGGDGGAGTNSTFSDGTNVLTLPGGNGGKGDLGGSTANMSAGGGPSAAATNSKFAGTGAPGDDTKKANVASKVVAGSGGSSRYGGGGKGGSNISQDGPAGTGFGSGGAGGSDIAATSAHVGGPGAPCLFILREYS